MLWLCVDKIILFLFYWNLTFVCFLRFFSKHAVFFPLFCRDFLLSLILWHDRTRKTEITERTGLPPLMHQIIRRRNSLFSHLRTTPRHIKLFGARSTSLVDGFQIVLRSALLVAQEASGWIRFALITTSQRLIFGDVPSVEVIPG